MLDRLAIPAEWLPLFIFLLRVLDMSFDTLRVLFVVRGRRAPAWLTGFIQSSTGTLSQLCTRPALSVWSHWISWLQQEA